MSEATVSDEPSADWDGTSASAKEAADRRIGTTGRPALLWQSIDELAWVMRLVLIKTCDWKTCRLCMHFNSNINVNATEEQRKTEESEQISFPIERNQGSGRFGCG